MAKLNQFCFQTTTPQPTRKYRAVVWERVIRCAELEIEAENEDQARDNAREHYATRRDEILPAEWDEDCMTEKRIPTGTIGRPREGICGGHRLLGIQVE